MLLFPYFHLSFPFFYRSHRLQLELISIAQQLFHAVQISQICIYVTLLVVNFMEYALAKNRLGGGNEVFN